ncbi:hypothetical protein [Ligilactobacillus murinus]
MLHGLLTFTQLYGLYLFFCEKNIYINDF